LTARPGPDPHELLIKPGSAWSVGTGPNTGKLANLDFPWHYPVEAECVCGLMVRREKPAPGQLDWMHLERKPGEP
jgi:hypothetical protein